MQYAFIFALVGLFSYQATANQDQPTPKQQQLISNAYTVGQMMVEQRQMKLTLESTCRLVNDGNDILQFEGQAPANVVDTFYSLFYSNVEYARQFLISFTNEGNPCYAYNPGARAIIRDVGAIAFCHRYSFGGDERSRLQYSWQNSWVYTEALSVLLPRLIKQQTYTICNQVSYELQNDSYIRLPF